MSPFSPSVRLRRGGFPLVAAAVATPLVVAAISAPAQALLERPSPTSARAAATHEVTLITGDVVTVTTMADGRQIAEVDRPADAVGGVRLQETGGDVYVVPDEAVALLGADRLDSQLFNVTDLIEMGYDEAGTGKVPMIATYTAAKTRAAGPPTAPKGSATVRQLPAIDGAALTPVRPESRTFWTTIAPEHDLTDPTPVLGAGVEKVWLDGRVQAELAESVPQVGAPAAWEAGFDGSGVKVAVLDTGIDVNHPDFAGQIAGTQSFVPGEGMADVNGHGTHVASTVAGTGAASEGANKGVAPGADLMVGKVLGGANGEGQDSWVLAGMTWAAQSGAEVVNMSLGDSFASDGGDPMSQAVDALSDQYGTLFVIASGNAGPESISSPGAAASALTVGAVDKQDNLAGFSSTGPLTRSGALKPDLVAPGVEINAAWSQDMAGDEDSPYRSLSGTSMATPHVAGAAAILADQHPSWTGQRIKRQLMSTAKGLEFYSPYEIGTGRLNVAKAVTSKVSATGSVLLGNYAWPHEASDVDVTKDVTFTNDGDQDVTLDLALTEASGAITLGASTVTVPAGGAATVPVTSHPQAVEVGRYAGFVVATEPGTGAEVTRTSVALIKEHELYDLTIKLVDRDGQPAAGWVSFNIAGDMWPWAEYVDGEKTLRMPPANYALTAYLDVAGEGPDRSGVAMVFDPETVLDHSTEVVLDAREANLVESQAPARTEDRQRKIDVGIEYDNGPAYRAAYLAAPAYDDIYVSPTDPLTQGEFMFTTRWRTGEPMLSLNGAGHSFETIVQPGSAMQTKTDTVRTVFAGDGAAADYAGLDAEGAIAVVERSDNVTPHERAAAATAAGALTLIVVNDGVGGLNEWVGSGAPDFAPASIPVATVHRDSGAGLIALAEKGTKLTAARKANTDVVYDLAREYPGHIPDQQLVYKPRHKDLARIDASYYAVRPGLASGYRYDVTLSPSLGLEEREHHPGTRVEWVTPGQEWVESHAQNIDGALPWPMVAGVNSYAKGSATELDWFRPATRPGFSDSFGVYNSRARDFMTWNVQAWSSFSDVMRLGGFLNWGETPTQLRVYQGKDQIHHNKYSADMQWVEVPAGNLPYRVVLDASRPADVFRLSTRTRTEWRYMSDTVDSDYFQPFSVMKLDYQLNTDLKGDVKAGKKHRIAVRPGVSDFGTLPGKLTKTKLYVSYNGGGKWNKVTLTKGKSGWWRGTIKAPKKPGGFISVKASATMDSGYAIKQEIIKAYGLR